ncbi:hypothetical protein [Stygiolobus caldivivus]|uniref:Uncharacterized protein n=1 Tax=Stygiolobus caldivivus TaxID=2824673 RepID=A0A8D5ZIX3_9CREN|nr:hypothetical protein [Stygiolobus caldivivus]BCU69780.1 hypothetical protein KN1_10770 [Stygiolobus caldivivus]
MKKIDVLSLILLTLFIIVVPVSTGQTPQSLFKEQRIATLVFKDVPSIQIDSVTHYDHGLVIAATYTNVTISSSSHKGHLQTGFYSVARIYFVNSSLDLELYKLALTGYSIFSTFVMNGELYVLVSVYKFAQTGNTYVYVFKGLTLVDTYTMEGDIFHVDLNNLTALAAFNNNCTIIMLNNTNITLRDLDPVRAVELPQGILTISNGSVDPHLFNISMFTRTGKVIWSKKYYVCSNLFSNTLVGDQLFIVVNNTPIPYSEIEIPKAPVNVSILGINLENGEVTTRLTLTSIILKIYLLNIGGSLYVALIGRHYATLERYNGSGLAPVAKIPIKTETEVIHFQNYFGSNVSITQTVVVSQFFSSCRGYFLVVNPTPSGSNVTDVYSGGVTHYFIRGNVSKFIGNNVLLFGDDGNFSLVVLNNNGTVRGTVNIGTSLFRSPHVRLIEADPYEYYLVESNSTVSSNGTAESEVMVYELTLALVGTTSHGESAARPAGVGVTVSPVVLVGIAIVAVIAVILLLKKFAKR